MTTLQTNLSLATHHLREINQEIARLKKTDLFEVIPYICEEKRGTYITVKGKRSYVKLSKRKEIFDKVERTMKYNELTKKKSDLEKWIRQIENELARLSSMNFPRVAI